MRAVGEGRDVEAMLQHGVGAHGFGERSGVQVRAVQCGKFVAGGAARALLATLDAGALGAGYAADSRGFGGGVIARAGGVSGAVAVEFPLAIARNAQPQVGAGSQRNLDANPARNATLRGATFLGGGTLPRHMGRPRRLKRPVLSSFSGPAGHDRFHLNERAAVGPADLPPDEQLRRAYRITGGGIITGAGIITSDGHSTKLVESSLKQVGVFHSIPL